MGKAILAGMFAMALLLGSPGIVYARQFFSNVTVDTNSMQTLMGRDLRKYGAMVQSESKFLNGKKPPRVKRQPMDRCGANHGQTKNERSSLSQLRQVKDPPLNYVCLCSNDNSKPVPLPPRKPDELKPKPTDSPAAAADTVPAKQELTVPPEIQRQMYQAPVTVTNPFGVAPKSGLPGDPDPHAVPTD